MPGRGGIGLLLVCDDTLERAGLKALLGDKPGIRIGGEASSFAELPRLVVDLNPDVIVFIQRSPGECGADIMADTINYASSVASARTIILASAPSELSINLLRSGSCAVLDRKIGSEELVAAIRMAAAGYLPVREKLVADLARATIRLQGAGDGAAEGIGTLTRQERRVLMLVTQGLSNQEIAESLVLAESTVKSHVQGILKKLGLRDRAQIIIYAYESGLVFRVRQPGAS